MAAGDTDVGICSRALTLLGAGAISSFSDGTDAANTCSRLYGTIKESLLSMYPWKFATKKVQLARLNTTPVNEWTYAYQLPGDALGNPEAVFTSSAIGENPINSGWEIYEDTLLTDEATIYIDYRFDPEESIYPRYFVMLLIYDLCAHLAEPITDQVTKADYWRSVAFGSPQENGRGGFFRQAANADARGNPTAAIFDFPLVDVRR
jgi:hypothetical protein